MIKLDLSAISHNELCEIIDRSSFSTIIEENPHRINHVFVKAYLSLKAKVESGEYENFTKNEAVVLSGCLNEAMSIPLRSLLQIHASGVSVDDSIETIESIIRVINFKVSNQSNAKDRV